MPRVHVWCMAWRTRNSTARIALCAVFLSLPFFRVCTYSTSFFFLDLSLSFSPCYLIQMIIWNLGWERPFYPCARRTTRFRGRPLVNDGRIQLLICGTFLTSLTRKEPNHENFVASAWSRLICVVVSFMSHWESIKQATTLVSRIPTEKCVYF